MWADAGGFHWMGCELGWFPVSVMVTRIGTSGIKGSTGLESRNVGVYAGFSLELGLQLDDIKSVAHFWNSPPC